MSSTFDSTVAASPIQRRYVSYMIATTAVLALLIVLPFFASPDMQELYLSEGGPVQVLSAAGYLVVAVTIVRESETADLRRHWYLVAIPIAMCMRELDFHAHFTTYSITKTLLYVSPDIPVIEKAFGITVFGILGLAGYLLVRRHGRNFVTGLLRGDLTSWAVAAAVACAVGSKVLDGAASNLAAFGIDIESTLLSVVIEEVLELGLPVFLVIAAFSFFDEKQNKRRRASAYRTISCRPLS